jgi:hypothetical protein
MGLFNKFWGSRIPAWGLVLKTKDFHSLMAMVGAETRARGFDFRFGEGTVRLEREGADPFEVDLRALVEECARTPTADWERLVNTHLDATLNAQVAPR